MIFANLFFAALAAITPTCHADQATNCKYVVGQTTMVSVQSSDVTVYFELRRGALTDLEVYRTS